MAQFLAALTHLAGAIEGVLIASGHVVFGLLGVLLSLFGAVTESFLPVEERVIRCMYDYYRLEGSLPYGSMLSFMYKMTGLLTVVLLLALVPDQRKQDVHRQRPSGVTRL